MKKTCRLVVENEEFTGVKIGEMFIPFENLSETKEMIVNVLRNQNSYWDIQREAQKLMNEQKSKNEIAINEIVQTLINNQLIPMAMA